jgi:MFS transporter, ACS family, glucarate transporter
MVTSLPVRWTLVAWLFVISAVGYLDRVNISIAGQSIKNEFHLDNVELGWIFSAFVLGYALFQAPAGYIADRLGPRLVLTLGVIWWALFTSLITLFSPSASGTILLLVATRFLLGMGEAVIYPASNCVIAAWIPSAERGIANGIIFSGVGFGAALTPPLITYLMIHSGWRSSFWASAALGLVAGAIWFLLSRDHPAHHPWISSMELAHIQSGLPQSQSRRPDPLPWSSILSNFNIWLVTASYFCYGYAAYIFFSWFFIYLSTVRGLNLRESSYYTMLPFAAMAIGSLAGGWISDRLTKTRGKRTGRCGVAAVGIVLSAIFIALGTQVDSARIASFVLAAGAGALYLSQSSFWSVSADIGGPSAGSVSGFMNMGGQIGGALTASLTPAIASHWGWSASFLVAAALCGVGSLLWTLVIL